MPEILIYSDIGESWFAEDSITGATIKPQLQGDLTVRVNSPGGDVFEGFAIYNLLKQHDGKVDVYVDGLAASAASIIAMAGDNVYMSETAMMMIHDPWTMALGNADDMIETAALLEKIKDSIIPAYTNRTGLSAEQVADMMKAETWMTGKEAAELGFASLIDDAAPRIENKTRPWIKNAPKQLQVNNAADPVAEPEQPPIEEPWRINLARRRLALTE